MNSRLLISLLALLAIGFCREAQGQADSLAALDLQEVVVTATRTEKLLSAVPMPVTLISQKQIQQMGSLRLNEILIEQTGLAIVNNHGQGVQMQGFDPDYTLILIDGEPLIGRTAGTIELSRLAVGNIKQIEIVKGATSSLYGSEALAGVINIITEDPESGKLDISGRYGSNQTADLGLNASFKKDKWKGNLFLNRYASGGYDFTPETFGNTVEPFSNYTVQSKLGYDFSSNLKLKLSGRYYHETQDNNFSIANGEDGQKVSGQGKVSDYNFNPTLDWRMSDRWKTQLRFYQSGYQAQSTLAYLEDGSLFETTFFRQSFTRPEIQTDFYLSDQHQFAFGIGNIWEGLEATRYREQQQFQTRYVFLQHEFTPTEKWHFVLGSRFDQHTVYGSQLSPKLAIQHDLHPKIALRASAGMGFKAPDFRQLYLNFNNAVAGYSVLGAEELPEILSGLQAQGLIAEVLLSPEAIGRLQAETSVGYNLGAKIKPTEKLTWNLNFFHNDVNNLIESQVVARRTNGQNIFSYRNINRIFTQGVETDLNYQAHPNLALSAGYQWLVAKDKEVLDQIAAGQVFRRNPETLQTTRVTEAAYGGLFGRSRNMLNLKAFYEHKAKGFTANLRAIYRGRYGLGDRNGNLILDDQSEYVPGFWTLNLSASKELFKNTIRWQAGVENLLGYTDALNIPNMPGRLLWTSLHFSVF